MNLAPEIMKEVFEIVEGPYALINKLKLKSRKIHTTSYRIETAYFVGARVGNSLPSAVTLNNVIYLSFSSQRSKIGFLKTALARFIQFTSNELATCKMLIKCEFL